MQSFKTKYKLNFPLLSDPAHKMLESYGAWRLKKFMGRSFIGVARSTFLIGSDGKIEHIWDPVTAKGHAAEVLEHISA
jgi:thioredoxin-dependent peroxiredoxin